MMDWRTAEKLKGMGNSAPKELRTLQLEAMEKELEEARNNPDKSTFRNVPWVAEMGDPIYSNEGRPNFQ